MEEYHVPRKLKKCCVPNCLNRRTKRHRLPKFDTELFKTWLQIIKPVDCDKLTTEQMYNRYYVCEDHFSSECFVPGTRRGLTRNAVPTLLVPGYSGTTELLECIQTAVPIKYNPREGENGVHEPKIASLSEWLIENLQPSISGEEKLQANFKITSSDKNKRRSAREDLEHEVDIMSSTEIANLRREIANLKRKTEEQEQTICKMKFLNDNLSKDLHNEKHRNLYLKNRVKLLEEKTNEKLVMNGITNLNQFMLNHLSKP